MWFRKNLWNRTLNTVAVAPRSTIWTWWHVLSDATKTAVYGVLNWFEWVGKTASSIADAVHNAFTKWKWYQRLWKIPVSLAASPFMAAEWVVETLWDTWCNFLRNARDTISNPILNWWRSLKWVWSSQSVWKFRFSHIDNRAVVSPKMKLASMFS